MNIRRRYYEPNTRSSAALAAGDAVIGLTRALLYAARPRVIWTTGNLEDNARRRG